MEKTIKTETLPVYWACALMYGDYSGLTDNDEVQLNDWLKTVNPGSCVEVVEGSENFANFKGLGCDVVDYIFTQR